MEESGVFFVTLCLIKKIPIFTNQSYLELIISSFNYCRKHYDLKFYYYVIMDNHIHMICRSERDLSRVLKHLKSYLAHEIITLLKFDSRDWIEYLLKHYKMKHKIDSEHQVWEEGSYPNQILDYKTLNQKADYIHNNPVRRGLVAEPKDWYYSSARNVNGLTNPFQIDSLEE